MKNTATTASVERIKNLKAIETDAAPGWEAQGVLRTEATDTANTSLLKHEPNSLKKSALVKRMPRYATPRKRRS